MSDNLLVVYKYLDHLHLTVSEYLCQADQTRHLSAFLCSHCSLANLGHPGRICNISFIFSLCFYTHFDTQRCFIKYNVALFFSLKMRIKEWNVFNICLWCWIVYSSSWWVRLQKQSCWSSESETYKDDKNTNKWIVKRC